MYARSLTLGILAASAVALTVPSTPDFTLDTTGAVGLSASGHEAQYGMVPAIGGGQPVLSVSLGATAAPGALQLYLPGDRLPGHRLPGHRLPAPGRYPVLASWDETASDTSAFHASFTAGTVEHPLGWFHGESGSVTITESGNGRMSGAFEIRARGFLAADLANEDRWVTVRGSFDAEGDSTVATIASVR
jgi:hypothetical protein